MKSTLGSQWKNFGFFAITWMALASLVFGQDLFTESELQAMSDDQLESICTERGFALVMDEIDPSTGLAYKFSHEDYVIAAQQCLAIEQEMNQLLDEHPELAAELEEEIRKMEAELEERQTEVDNLQSQLSEAENSASGSESSASGAAFVSRTDDAGESSTGDDRVDAGLLDESVDSDTVSSDGGVGSSQNGGDLEQGGSIEEPDSTYQPDADTIASTTESGGPDVDEESSAEEIQDLDKDAGVQEREDANSAGAKEDLTMNGIVIEILQGLIRQANADVKRIAELMAPVLQSMMRAGDVAWRHIRAILLTLQKHYNDSRSGETENSAEQSEA